ncbi:MAG: T9SS type A sorting domain-containing protein, partial [Bacteroidota bacterium]|nr:T9SS type A sorting domain-containing protein [Bacteroidota bacterium]
LSSGVCPLCGWQDAENTINPRPAYMATNTTAKLIVQVDNGSAIAKNNIESAITIMNNSAHGSFKLITGNDQLMGAAFRVIDINGKTVKTGFIKAEVQDVTVDAPNGIYLFQFLGEGSYAGKKVLIK